MAQAPTGRRDLALCLASATLLYLRQIANWGIAKNRFFFHWQRSDMVTIAVGIMVLTLLFYVVVQVLRRSWPRSAETLLAWLAILFVADIVVGYARSGRLQVWLVALGVGAWAVIAGLALYAMYRRPTWRLLERGTNVLVALAWLAPLSAVQMLFWKSWDVRPTVTAAALAPPRQDRTPVFVILFDEWSYQRSYDGGELLPFFRHLRQFAGRAFEFGNAHSPGPGTEVSLPRLLYQRPGALRIGNGVAVWQEGDSTVPAAEVPNLFAAADARGYQTSITGFYFPYRAILGDQVDHIASAPHAPKGRTFGERLRISIVRNLNSLADPLSWVLFRRWWPRVYSENWFQLNREILDTVRATIRRAPANTFALFHLPLPHAPFVFNEDGSYRGAFSSGGRMEGTPEDYRRHLHVVDRVFGELMAELDSAGLLDPALIVVTSDHSWKAEPDSALRARPSAVTWVPLFVKLPYQRTPARVSGRFCLGQLGALVARVMDTTLTERNAAAEILALPVGSPCSDAKLAAD